MLPCNGCAYRRNIPGDCHSRCVFDWLASPHERPKNRGSDRTQRWFMFPVNYDPVWGPDECPARSEVLDKEKVAKPNPLLDLLAMLR